ncbi:MAG: FxsA family protein [Planctomycetaceae bacterium]|nr:FxsA family protein [Planctomycetaceae bacterium]
MRLILLFVMVPLIELFILLKLADLITGWRTFAIVVITGVVGATLARHQGWNVIRRLQHETRSGQLPTTTLVDALMIFVAGALLITPGILTDVVGFSLLVPMFRAIYRRWLMTWFRKRVQVQGVTASSFGGAAPFRAAPFGSDDLSRDQVIDSFVIDADSKSTNGESDR